jgi:hypothetical protein
VTDPLVEARSLENYQRRSAAMARLCQTQEDVVKFYYDLDGLEDEIRNQLWRIRETGDLALYFAALGNVRLLARRQSVDDAPPADRPDLS